MWILWAGLSARADIIDRVVVVVESEPILESQVRLEGDLSRYDPSPLPLWFALHPDPLDEVVDETLVRAMASDVALYQPTREQVETRREALRAAFPSPSEYDAFLARHALDDEGLATVLKRRMVVERYLLRNLLTSPDDSLQWMAECRALLDQNRPRVRIRRVDPISSTDSSP